MYVYVHDCVHIVAWPCSYCTIIVYYTLFHQWLCTLIYHVVAFHHGYEIRKRSFSFVRIVNLQKIHMCTMSFNLSLGMLLDGLSSTLNIVQGLIVAIFSNMLSKSQPRLELIESRYI